MKRKDGCLDFVKKSSLLVAYPPGNAKYPSVSLSALNRKEKEKLYRALDMLKHDNSIWL